MFVDLVIACRADHFQNSDIAMLCVYCRAIVLEKAASAGLKADGYVAADGKSSGWLPVLQAASRTISTYSRMLRLNPSARQTSPSSEPEPISYYERQRLLEGRDDAN
jgi:phage terminase small subunit